MGNLHRAPHHQICAQGTHPPAKSIFGLFSPRWVSRSKILQIWPWDWPQKFVPISPRFHVQKFVGGSPEWVYPQISLSRIWDLSKKFFADFNFRSYTWSTPRMILPQIPLPQFEIWVRKFLQISTRFHLQKVVLGPPDWFYPKNFCRFDLKNLYRFDSLNFAVSSLRIWTPSFFTSDFL